MFTPPPQSEADAVRLKMGAYWPCEITMAFHMQTKNGQPWNVHLFFDQYQSVEEYLEHNSAADIAGQIDWWTRTRIHNAEESLGEDHLGNYECYFEELEKIVDQNTKSQRYRNKQLLTGGEMPPGWGLRYQKLPDRNDDEFWACKIEDRDTDWCNYSPDHDEIAQELIDVMEYWDEALPEIHEEITEHPKFDQLIKDLGFYAKERRALAEAAER